MGRCDREWLELLFLFVFFGLIISYGAVKAKRKNERNV